MFTNNIDNLGDCNAETLSLGSLVTSTSERAIYIDSGTDEIHFRDWEYEFAQSNGASSTTSATFINKLSLVTATLPAGTYRIMFSCQLTNSSAGSGSQMEITEEEAALGANQIHEASLPTIISNNSYITISGFFQTTLNNAAYTYEMNFLAIANTARIRQAKIMLNRIF